MLVSVNSIANLYMYLDSIDGLFVKEVYSINFYKMQSVGRLLCFALKQS